MCRHSSFPQNLPLQQLLLWEFFFIFVAGNPILHTESMDFHNLKNKAMGLFGKK